VPRILDDIGRTVSEAVSPTDVTLLDRLRTTELRGIRVFDVGQGDCIGLLDQDDHVFCYVDYGGLANHPDAAMPSDTATRLPVQLGNRFVSIILTHWDKDHYYSAYKKNPAAGACEWIVPRQWASPHAVSMAARLKNGKCWPESVGATPTAFAVGPDHEIEIRKCQPFNRKDSNQDRNSSGLAVTLRLSTKGRLVSYMLLPGDCHYDGIPARPLAPIRALVAYHHGSKTDWTTHTAPAIAAPTPNHALVYSYGHPKWTPAIANYSPDWDPPATHTPSLRAGRGFVDVPW